MLTCRCEKTGICEGWLFLTAVSATLALSWSLPDVMTNHWYVQLHGFPGAQQAKLVAQRNGFSFVSPVRPFFCQHFLRFLRSRGILNMLYMRALPAVPYETVVGLQRIQSKSKKNTRTHHDTCIHHRRSQDFFIFWGEGNRFGRRSRK